MRIGKQKRPYFDRWLKRTGKQLAVSGALMQVAHHLAQETGENVEKWRQHLRDILEGKADPSVDLLTRIDALLVGTAQPRHSADSSHQGDLFG